MSQEKTTKWTARPITRGDALVCVGIWGALDLLKTALGAELALILAGTAALVLAWIWWRTPADG